MNSQLTICIAFDHQHEIARHIAHTRAIPLMVLNSTKFTDGQWHVQTADLAPVRGARVVVVAHTGHAVHDQIMLILLSVSALKLQGAVHCTVVLTYYAYTRQAHASFEPLKTLERMLHAAGVDRLILVEPHEATGLGAGLIPTETVSLHAVLAQHIKATCMVSGPVCVVAPDQGAVVRATAVAKLLQLPLVTVCKERVSGTVQVALDVPVDGYTTALVLDDMVDTGSTMLAVANMLRQQGVQQVHAYAVHGVFSLSPQELFGGHGLDSLTICPTIPQPASARVAQIHQLSPVLIAQELAQII